jgi:hypothetical protein
MGSLVASWMLALRLSMCLPTACLGLLIGAVGLPVVGAPMLALGVLAFALAIVAASVGAVRRRGTNPWFGPRAAMEDLNAPTGWGLLLEAPEWRTWSAERIRAWLHRIVVATVAMTITALVVGALR